MKLIDTGIEIIDQEFTEGNYLNDMFKHIEKCGRVCYKSDDLTTETSAMPFVKRMIENKHYAMLEHGTIYLVVPGTSYNLVNERQIDYMNNKNMFGSWVAAFNDIKKRYTLNKYSKVIEELNKLYITTNFRVIIENNWLDDLLFMTDRKQYHDRRVTVNFSIDRFTGEEFLRHRPFSFARESTRFCNYSKDKFDNGVTFTYVPWCSTDDAVEPEHNVEEWGTILPYNTNNWNAIDWWLWGLSACETSYLNLIKHGWSPQQARVVLPCGISSPLVMTGFVSDWMHYFDLRYFGKTGKPHPQAFELAKPLYKEFIDRGYIDEYDYIISNNKNHGV